MSPALSRVDRTFLRRRGPSDATQVPFGGAQVDFYRQGATVGTTTPAIGPGSSATIDVFGVGGLAPNTSLQAGLDGPMPLVVLAVDVPERQVTVRNDSGQSVSMPAGTRLILLSNRPVAYSDPYGTNSLGSSIATDPFGRAAGYVSERRLDLTVKGQGAAQLYIDAEGPFFDGLVVLNALDYPTLQGCVDSVPIAGGIVMLPPGQYSPGSIPRLDPPLTLPGDGLLAAIDPSPPRRWAT